MSKSQLTVFGVALGIIVLLLLIGVVVKARRRREVEANRAEAFELREERDRAGLHAEEQAADAASADARARQARVEAQKLEREATARTEEARGSRDRAQEHHRRAIELDPDSDRQGESDDQRRDSRVPAEDQRS